MSARERLRNLNARRDRGRDASAATITTTTTDTTTATATATATAAATDTNAIGGDSSNNDRSGVGEAENKHDDNRETQRGRSWQRPNALLVDRLDEDLVPLSNATSVLLSGMKRRLSSRMNDERDIIESSSPKSRQFAEQLRAATRNYQMALKSTRERMASIVQQFQTTLEQQTKHTEQLELRLAETVALLQAREGELDVTREAQIQLLEVRDTLTHADADWQTMQNDMETQIKERSMEIAALQERLGDVVHVRDEMERKYLQSNDRVALLQDTRDELTDKSSSLELQVRQLSQQLRESEQKRTKVTQELVRERVRWEKQSSMMMGKVVGLERHVIEQKETHEREAKSINGRISTVNVQVREANARTRTVEQEAVQLRAERDELRQVNTKLNRDVYILNNKQGMHEHMARKYEENIRTLQTQVRLLLQEIRRLKDVQNKQQTDLVATQSAVKSQRALHKLLMDGNHGYTSLPPIPTASAAASSTANTDKRRTRVDPLDRVQFKLNMISESIDAFFPDADNHQRHERSLSQRTQRARNDASESPEMAGPVSQRQRQRIRPHSQQRQQPKSLYRSAQSREGSLTGLRHSQSTHWRQSAANVVRGQGQGQGQDPAGEQRPRRSDTMRRSQSLVGPDRPSARQFAILRNGKPHPAFQ